jgi:hypothetical protein
MCISFIILLYIIILTLIMTRNSNHIFQHQVNQRSNQKCYNSFCYTIFIFSLLIFEVLLANKLDQDMYSIDLMNQFQFFLQQNNQNNNNMKTYMNELAYGGNSYKNLNQFSSIQSLNGNSSSTSSCFTLISIPLYIAYMSLICLSFNNRSGNTWWFGMRRDFCDIFLNVCPIFQTYGNIQIKFQNQTSNDENETVSSNNRRQPRNQQPQRSSIYLNNNTSITNQEQTINLIDNGSNQTSILTINNRSNINNSNNSTNNVLSSSINLNNNNDDDLNLSIDTQIVTPNTSQWASNGRSIASLTTNASTSRKFRKNFDSNSANGSVKRISGNKVLRNFRKSGSKMSNINKISFKSNQSVPLTLNSNNFNNNIGNTLVTNVSEKCSIKSNNTVSYVQNPTNKNNTMLNINNNNNNNRNMIKQLDLPD